MRVLLQTNNPLPSPLQGEGWGEGSTQAGQSETCPTLLNCRAGIKLCPPCCAGRHEGKRQSGINTPADLYRSLPDIHDDAPFAQCIGTRTDETLQIGLFFVGF